MIEVSARHPFGGVPWPVGDYPLWQSRVADLRLQIADCRIQMGLDAAHR